MIRTILAPTDFSKGGRASVEYAAKLGAQFGGGVLWLLHVGTSAEIGETSPGAAAEIYHRVREDTARRAHLRMGQLVSEISDATPQIEVRSHFASGVPHEAIIASAKELDADLIVMGTAGLTGLSHFLIGSTAERVVRLSPVPVLTVRSDTTSS